MRKKDLIEEQWYWIDYDDPEDADCSFHGPAKLTAGASRGLYPFTSSLFSTGPFIPAMFALQDIKCPCDPIPDFNDLVRKNLYAGTAYTYLLARPWRERMIAIEKAVRKELGLEETT